MNHSEAQEGGWYLSGKFQNASLPAPEYPLHTGNPEDLGNRETGIAITLQVFSNGYREILAIKPCQMVLYFVIIPPGSALESTPVCQ